MVKVLYILPQPYLLSRGSSFRAFATLNAISAHGMECHMLCYPFGEEPREHQYHIFRSAKVPGISRVKIGPSLAKLALDGPLMLKALKLARKNQYDVIHGVEEAGFIAAAIGRKVGIPFIFDMHSWMSQQLEDCHFLKSKRVLELFKKMEKGAMRQAQAIITVGPEMT